MYGRWGQNWFLGIGCKIASCSRACTTTIFFKTYISFPRIATFQMLFWIHLGEKEIQIYILRFICIDRVWNIWRVFMWSFSANIYLITSMLAKLVLNENIWSGHVVVVGWVVVIAVVLHSYFMIRKLIKTKKKRINNKTLMQVICMQSISDPPVGGFVRMSITAVEIVELYMEWLYRNIYIYWTNTMNVL